MSVQYIQGKKVLEINTDEFDTMMNKLTPTELRKAVAKGMRRAGRILVQQTEQNFSTLRTKHATARGALYPSSYKGKKTKVVSMKVYDKDPKKPPFVNISISSKNVDFRAKWFELGTKERTTKKGYKRGKIIENRPLFRAKQQTEKRVFEELGKHINYFVIKAGQNNKK